MRLLWRVARGRFGSRLLLKLAAIFALVGILPGVLIYAVSYQFVSRSIESWFDVKVEGALDAGLNLGRGTIDSIVTDLGDQDPPGRRAPRRERGRRPSRWRSSGCASSSRPRRSDRRQRRARRCSPPAARAPG